nr:MAG TPA: hypothetical protein [Caudoviricetes sp.]
MYFSIDIIPKLVYIITIVNNKTKSRPEQLPTHTDRHQSKER